MLVRAVPSTLSFVALALLAAVTVGCGGSPTTPSGSAGFSQTDLRVGTGAEAASGRLVNVHYTGWLLNAAAPDQKGAVFDSSTGATPFSFTLGAGQVIAGWDRGVVGMKVGGLRRLIIPPSLGYGGSRSGPLPPNATMLFEIELLEVQ